VEAEIWLEGVLHKKQNGRSRVRYLTVFVSPPRLPDIQSRAPNRMKSRGPRVAKPNISDALEIPTKTFDPTMQRLTKTDEHAIARTFIDHASHFLVRDYLPKIERCLEKLSDEQIWWRANEESNSIGNLILHLCGNARQWIVCGVGSAPDSRDRDSEFEQRDVIPRDRLLTLLRSTLSDVEATL
jgi:hypothetical protein